MLSTQRRTFDAAWDQGTLDFIRQCSPGAGAAAIADCVRVSLVPHMQEIIVEMLAHIERC